MNAFNINLIPECTQPYTTISHIICGVLFVYDIFNITLNEQPTSLFIILIPQNFGTFRIKN